MPTVEIDEVEFQQNKNLRDFVNRAMNNPRLKKDLLKLEKAVYPGRNIEIPEDPTEEALVAQRKEFDDYKKEQAEKEAKREQEDKIRSLKAQKDEGIAQLRRDGWLKEAIEEVEKIMDDKGILDPAIAAAYYEKQHPPQEPSNPSSNSTSWGFFEAATDKDQDDYTKKLFETKGDDIGNLALREASKTLGELRNQRAKR